jgi:hypothetical protein
MGIYSPKPNKMRDYIKKVPKYLLLDIETLPCTVYVWGLYKQRIQHTNIVTDWCVLSWKAKWLYGADMMGDILTPEETKTQDDRRILKSIWALLEESDCVIAHNGKKFDLRKLNARFWHHKMKPPTPYQIIDTLKESQKVLGTTSHRLDYLGKYMVNQGKMETNFDLWIRCFHGEQEALDYMFAYNEEDVVLLEEIYLELRPWIKSHPNYAIFSEATVPCCTYCGSDDIVDAGIYTTPAGRFISKRCGECGGIFRERFTDLTREERNNLLISAAR